MCECGCSQGPNFFFPGPDGITYGLELYRGCRDCGNAPGVALYRIPDGELEHFGPEADQMFGPPWVTCFNAWQEFAVPLVDRALLAKAIAGDDDGDLITESVEAGDLDPDRAKELAECAWKALLRVAFKQSETPR